MTRGKTIFRWLFDLCGLTLLILCVALAVLWWRSWKRQEYLSRNTADEYGKYSLSLILSSSGRVAFICTYHFTASGMVLKNHRWHYETRRQYTNYEDVYWMSYRQGPMIGGFRVIYLIFHYRLLLLFNLVMLISWYRLRRRLREPFPPGSCARCGYILQGNVSGICPECGTACKAANQAGASPAAGI